MHCNNSVNHQLTSVLFLPTQKLLKACAAVRQFTLNFNELQRLLFTRHLAGLVSRSFMKSCVIVLTKTLLFYFVKLSKGFRIRRVFEESPVKNLK